MKGKDKPLIILLDKVNRGLGGIGSLNRDLMASPLNETFEFVQSGCSEIKKLLNVLCIDRPVVLVFDESFCWKKLPYVFFFFFYSKVAEQIIRKRRVLISREHHYSPRFFHDLVRNKKLFAFMLRCAYACMDGVISISDSQHKWLLSCRLCPQAKMIMIQHSIDPRSLIKLDHAKSKVPVIFGFLGRFVRQKGIDRLLACWKMLPANIEARLIIAGDGPLRRELQREVASISNVTLVGPLKDCDFYSQCQVVVMPSRYEPFGQIGIETRAAGRLLLVSDVDALPDQIKECKCGWLCDFDNPGHFERVVDQIIDLNKVGELWSKEINRMNRETTKDMYSQYLQAFSEFILSRLTKECKCDT